MKADNVNKNFVVGIYDDEDILLHAVPKIRKAGVKIHEVYSPFPVHGLDDALGYKRSRLPIAAFFFGLLGTSLALFMQIWMLGIDWPMIIGGKDYVPLPTFVPVTFELTVLLASLGMVATFFVVSDLKPYGKARIFDLRSTDDKHVLAVDLGRNTLGIEQLKTILTDAGASEVNEKIFD
jgi:hypothetical protein